MAEAASSSTTLRYYTRRLRLKCQKNDQATNKHIISGCQMRFDLCHILSFLPNKYAVGTCILSKRWSHLWTSVRTLDFDDNLIRDRKISGDRREHERLFMNFVARVMFRHEIQSIRKFCFRIRRCYDSSHVNEWICAATMRDIEKLDLAISTGKVTVQLPCSFFSTCKKLKVLALHNNIVLNVPEFVCFRSLRMLHIERLQCLDDDSVKRHISGSPVLEELAICRDDDDNVRALYVQSYSLKYLKIQSGAVLMTDIIVMNWLLTC